VDITYYAPGPRVEPVTYITIHTRIPKDWNTPPYLWAWRASDHENAFDAWPGEMMYKWGEWYELEIPTWCDSIVINDGGSTLTVDLNIEPGVELWVDVYTPDIVNIYPYEPGPRTEDSDPEPTTPESTAPTETSPAETRPTETNPTETDSQPTTPQKNDDDTPASAFFPDTLISVLILCAIVFGILGTGTAAYLILRKK
jgi:hypothetical protein